MHRSPRRSIVTLLLLVGLIAGTLGCGGGEDKKKDKAAGGSTETGTVKEFDMVAQPGLVAKGVYRLSGDQLHLAMGFPNSPRITDLDSKEEMTIIMKLKRQSGDASTIVGKWTIDSAQRGGEADTEVVGEVIEFTADKMIHTRGDGKKRENAYRLGGVPAQPAAGQAESVALLKTAGAEIELGGDGNAESVVVMFQPLNEEQLTALTSLSSIKTLELIKVKGLTADSISAISKLTELENLSLMSDELTDDWLAPVSKLSRLAKLELSSCRQLRGAGLKHLSGLTTLTELRVADTKVDDAGVASLKDLVNLEVLELKRTDVTDKAIPLLKGMTRLRELDLSGPGVMNGKILSSITDTAVEHLGKMKSLQTIGLGATNLTDTGLFKLSALPNLKVLHIGLCEKVTDEGVSKFKAAAPNCRVHGPDVTGRATPPSK